jgi:RNA polymerase sigma-70 factor, ECF subfamily
MVIGSASIERSAQARRRMRAELVERARGGDPEAFGQLAAGEVQRLLIVARLIVRDRDLADDVVQETLVRCWRYLPTLRDIGRFEAWLDRILMRAVADQAKRYRRPSEMSMDAMVVEPAVADEVGAVDDREQLERGFRQLSIDHRSIVVLHRYLGLSMIEVADQLGIPEGTAKSRYHYAMSALRAALEADGRLPVPAEVLA